MKVGIVGLGLIGGSLALDLRSRGMVVLGVSRQKKTAQIALARGIVDGASDRLDLLSAVEVAFLCTPLRAIASTLKSLVPHLPPEAVVTDVGSVKAPIVEECTPLWRHFVGGHPMAGTAGQGIEAAQSHLFAKAPYVLTPTGATPAVAVEKIAAIAHSLGSTVYCCPPDVHDRAVAWISHLPLMVSAGLIAACSGEGDGEVLDLARKLASSGFRDTSRVGGGNPELGVMVARYNRPALLRSLQQYRQCLDRFIAAIEAEDWLALAGQLELTQQQRSQFLRAPSD